MPLSYKSRRRWALIILIFGLPAYIVMAVTAMTLLFPDPTAKPSIWVELAIYVGLGVLWAFPLKAVFKGIGQADPERPRQDEG